MHSFEGLERFEPFERLEQFKSFKSFKPLEQMPIAHGLKAPEEMEKKP